MAIIIEDGTGKADAESYISVADATVYHGARGNAGWAALASDTVREQLLRKATEYMLQVYRDAWKGSRVKNSQALDWPRAGVSRDTHYDVAINVVPVEVARACAELALKANSETLAADLERGILREKIGPLDTTYDRSSPQYKRFRAVDMMVRPYLTGFFGSQISVSRA